MHKILQLCDKLQHFISAQRRMIITFEGMLVRNLSDQLFPIRELLLLRLLTDCQISRLR